MEKRYQLRSGRTTSSVAFTRPHVEEAHMLPLMLVCHLPFFHRR